jgi:uncharacterized protein (TIGR03382 family)
MRTPLRAGLVLLVVASPALAQTISLNFGGFGGGGAVTSLPFSRQSCLDGNSYIIQWTASGLGGACSDMQIFVTPAQGCPPAGPNTLATDGGTPADVILETVSVSDLQAGSGQIASKRLRDMPSLGGNCPDGQDYTNAICAFVRYRPSTTNCDGTASSSTNLTLHYDAIPPVPPSMNVLAQDSKIVVQLGPEGETLSRYETQYAEAPSGDAGPVWRQGPNLEASKTSVSITGLTNGQTYLVQARSVDVVDNVSAYTSPLNATPEASNGFWGEYKDAGGHELGGCSTAGAAMPSVLGALGVLVALLRRRR